MMLLKKDNNVSYFDDVVEMHVDEVAFLWLLRSVAVDQPQYSSPEVAAIEERIDKHINALLLHPDLAWTLCQKSMEFQEAGESFSLAVVAFRSLEVKKIQVAVEMGLTNGKTFKGLVSALGWLEQNVSLGWLKKFVFSKNLDHKHLAIAAYSILRVDPGDILTTLFQREDCTGHQALHARALRLIGEIKRADLAPVLEESFSSEEEDVAFWAIWSSLMLGNRAVLGQIKPYVITPGQFQIRAVDLAFRVLTIGEARQWIGEMSQVEGQSRIVLRAIMALGDPHAIGWVLQKMKEPELARLAGETFSTITGIDLEQNKLINDIPNLDDQLTLDERLDIDDIQEDENLPWPNSEKIAAVWLQYGQQFIAGQRYFMGKVIEMSYLQKIVLVGSQRQRRGAALQMALLRPEEALINIKSKVSGR